MAKSIVNLPADIFWLIQHYVDQHEATKLVPVCQRFNEAFVERAWVRVPSKLVKHGTLLAQDLMIKYGGHVRTLEASDALHAVFPLPFWTSHFTKVRKLVINERPSTASTVKLPIESLFTKERLSQFPALSTIKVHVTNFISESVRDGFIEAVNGMPYVTEVWLVGEMHLEQRANLEVILTKIDQNKEIYYDLHLIRPMQDNSHPLMSHNCSVAINVDSAFYGNRCTHAVNNEIFVDGGKPLSNWQLSKLSFYLGKYRLNEDERGYIPTPEQMPLLNDLTIKSRSCANRDCSDISAAIGAMFVPAWPQLQRLELDTIDTSTFHTMLSAIPNTFNLIVSVDTTMERVDLHRVFSALPRLVKLDIAADTIAATCPRKFFLNLTDDVSLRKGFMANSRVASVTLSKFTKISSLAFAIVFGLPRIHKVNLNGKMANLVDIRDMINDMSSTAKKVTIKTGSDADDGVFMACVRNICPSLA
ncbi:hypothetical protein GQ42DRAFT_180668 [Ramicandelaber brevisporus]|nr:hypothetical protein GQ42DRAFT_180668 [Ramicandelaber brevisporus]